MEILRRFRPAVNPHRRSYKTPEKAASFISTSDVVGGACRKCYLAENGGFSYVALLRAAVAYAPGGGERGMISVRLQDDKHPPHRQGRRYPSWFLLLAGFPEWHPAASAAEIRPDKRPEQTRLQRADRTPYAAPRAGPYVPLRAPAAKRRARLDPGSGRPYPRHRSPARRVGRRDPRIQYRDLRIGRLDLKVARRAKRNGRWAPKVTWRAKRSGRLDPQVTRRAKRNGRWAPKVTWRAKRSGRLDLRVTTADPQVTRRANRVLPSDPQVMRRANQVVASASRREPSDPRVLSYDSQVMRRAFRVLASAAEVRSREGRCGRPGPPVRTQESQNRTLASAGT
jgi:hypothetical protein